jgi:hypothetical protein
VLPVREACQRRSTCKHFTITQIRNALTPRSIRDFSALVKVKAVCGFLRLTKPIYVAQEAQSMFM